MVSLLPRSLRHDDKKACSDQILDSFRSTISILQEEAWSGYWNHLRRWWPRGYCTQCFSKRTHPETWTTMDLPDSGLIDPSNWSSSSLVDQGASAREEKSFPRYVRPPPSPRDFDDAAYLQISNLC